MLLELTIRLVFVENENFRALVKSLNPAFAIPGVKGFKCKMQEKYKSKVSEVAEILNDKKNTVVSVSVDYWSSGDYTSYDANSKSYY